MKKQIAILGSTGSIGTQALQVIEEHPDLYEVYALTANNKVDLLAEQARKFQPEVVVIANEDKYGTLKEALADLPIKVYAGAEALCQVVEAQPIDIVLTAMVGYAGLKPTINAIKARKTIALANKETLVVAGELITALASQYQTPILPVDSEHSAIFQCLEMNNPVHKVILTASAISLMRLCRRSRAGEPLTTCRVFCPNSSWLCMYRLSFPSSGLRCTSTCLLSSRVWLKRRESLERVVTVVSVAIRSYFPLLRPFNRSSKLISGVTSSRRFLACAKAFSSS